MLRVPSQIIQLLFEVGRSLTDGTWRLCRVSQGDETSDLRTWGCQNYSQSASSVKQIDELLAIILEDGPAGLLDNPDFALRRLEKRSLFRLVREKVVGRWAAQPGLDVPQCPPHLLPSQRLLKEQEGDGCQHTEDGAPQLLITDDAEDPEERAYQRRKKNH